MDSQQAKRQESPQREAPSDDPKKELTRREPPTRPWDKFAEHVGAYVDSAPSPALAEKRFTAWFEHCHESMLEVLTDMILPMDSRAEVVPEGVRSRLECQHCGFRVELVLRPLKKKDGENGQ